MLKIFFPAFLMVIFWGCSSAPGKPGEEKAPEKTHLQKKKIRKTSSQDISLVDTTTSLLNQDKIKSLVHALPEIREANHHIDSVTGHQHGISMIIETPNETEPEYLVRVGYDNDSRFETYYLLYVDPKSGHIKIEDPLFAEEGRIGIEDWRKKKAM